MCRARPVMMWLPCTRHLRLEQLPGLSPTPESSHVSITQNRIRIALRMPFPFPVRPTSCDHVQRRAVSGCPARGRRCSCQPSHPHRNANPNSLCPNQANSMFSHYWTTRDALVSPAARSGALENWRGECLTLVKFRRGASPAWKEEEVGVFSGRNGGEAGGLGRSAGQWCHVSRPPAPLQLRISLYFHLSSLYKTKF